MAFTVAHDARWAAALFALSVLACSKEEKTEPTYPRSDWTMLGYDVRSSYWNQAERRISKKNVKNLKLAWSFDVGAPPTGAPVVVGDRVFVNAQGLFAIDANTGAQIWKNDAIAGSASLAYENGVLYVHDNVASLRAVNADTGQELWSVGTAEAPSTIGFSSPIVTKEYVLLGSSSAQELVLQAGETATFRGFVIAIRKDGSVAWRKYTVEPPSNGVGIWSSVSVDEDAGMVFAGTGNNYTGPASDTSDAFLAIRLSGEGDFLWKHQAFEGDVWVARQQNGNPDYDFGANPILIDVEGRKLVAGGAKSGNFLVLDRTTGALLQERNLGPGSTFKGGIFNNGAWDGKHILVACNGAQSEAPGSEPAEPATSSVIFALDPLTLEIIWERQINGITFSPITVANGVGFIGKDKTLQAFDTSTGEVLFEFATEATIASAPVVANGRVVFGSGISWLVGNRGTKYYALSFDGSGGGNGTEQDAAAAPTFTEISQNIINQATCGGPACHTANVGGLQFGSPDELYAALIDEPATGPSCNGGNHVRVVPGDPDASLLYSKLLDAPPCGARMPIVGSLKPEQIELVRLWIAAGAKKD
jgi:polyvinyl alcohol dehydrogenase (cytochrome)